MNHPHQGLGPVTRLGPAEYEEHSTATHGRSWVGRYLTEVPRGTNKKNPEMGWVVIFFELLYVFVKMKFQELEKKQKNVDHLDLLDSETSLASEKTVGFSWQVQLLSDANGGYVQWP
jgi:hypothetical protein